MSGTLTALTDIEWACYCHLHRMFCFPALKDTLGLIAKQSEELETHAEHLYESVLAAVGPMRGEDGMEDEGVQQKAAPWVSRGGKPAFLRQGEREGGVGRETLKLANTIHQALLLFLLI